MSDAHIRITLSEAMRQLGLHPQDKKRERVKRALTLLPENTLIGKYKRYDLNEVLKLKNQTTTA